MKLRLEQFCPMVFPPGAGGHFFWDLMSMHPHVMPLSEDQMMQKLFKIKLVYGIATLGRLKNIF